MSRRSLTWFFIVLSAFDFFATIFLVHNGYADEANPLIRSFSAMFSTFWMGLAVYKAIVVSSILALMIQIHRQSPGAARGLLVFANTVMLVLGGWHAYAIGASLWG